MARPMTMAEKILAAHAGLDEVEPGQLIECNLDLVLSNDITSPIAIKNFKEIGVEKVFDPTKIALVPDHYVPNKDIKSAEQAKQVRDFAREQGITHYYEVGCMGVEHALLPEQGVVGAGDLIIGADSHTCTYGALGAFSTGVGSTDAPWVTPRARHGSRCPKAAVQDRGRTCPRRYRQGRHPVHHRHDRRGRRAVQGHGIHGQRHPLHVHGPAPFHLQYGHRGRRQGGLIEVDDIARAYMDGRTERPYTEYHSDPDAVYAHVYEIDAADIPATVAWPHLPSNTRPAAESRDVKIDQAVIGSCTNGRLEDMRQAADVLRGRKVHPDVRCIVIPATQAVYKQCIAEASWTCSLTRTAPCPRPRAARAWAATWASSPQASAACPRRTATSSAAWATPPAKCTWQARPWLPHPPCSATSACRKTSRRKRKGKESPCTSRVPRIVTVATSTPTSSSRPVT